MAVRAGQVPRAERQMQKGKNLAWQSKYREFDSLLRVRKNRIGGQTDTTWKSCKKVDKQNNQVRKLTRLACR